MQDQRNVIDCYNKTAAHYADKFVNELEHKHLDRVLLRAFIAENKHKGTLLDLGCGPGQTTRFLSDNGASDIVGTDLVPAMVTTAKKLHPHLHFEQADMLQLPYPNQHFGSAIAFYSIVHFDDNQLQTALREVRRVLVRGGDFLFAFHIGESIIHLDSFLDKPVDIDFYLFNVQKVQELVENTGFTVVDSIERQPYTNAEHPTKRAYMWVTNTHKL